MGDYVEVNLHQTCSSSVSEYAWLRPRWGVPRNTYSDVNILDHSRQFMFLLEEIPTTPMVDIYIAPLDELGTVLLYFWDCFRA